MMHDKLNFKIYYPLAPNIREKGLDKIYNDYFNKCAEELLALSGIIEFNLQERYIYSPNIYLDRDYRQHSKRVMYSYESLVFEADLPIYYSDIQPVRLLDGGEEEPLSKEETISMFIQLISEYFVDSVHKFLILSQISKPGFLSTWYAEVLVENIFYSSYYSLQSPLRAHRINPYNQLSWPNLKDLPILQAYEWFNSCNFSFDRLSRTKTERALNAFTHIFQENNDAPNRLFWNMVAIEALYCSSRSELGDQINKKTQIVLGEYQDIAKFVKKLYDFRSSFIHGDLDIPSIFAEIDVEEKNMSKYTNDLVTYSNLALAVLIATFQEMVIRDISILSFKYELI